uniref:peptidoglycan-binding domain-containing protein n=1 Tax=Rhodoblastus sp. TaxID=1962975 RepID=UPI003F977006
FKIAPPAPPAHPTSLDALLNEDIPQGALKPVDPGQGAAFAAAAAGEQAAADAPEAVPAPVAPPKARGDMLGALIADNGVVTADMRAARGSRAVLSAQKALAALGLPVKADGEYGAATRRAVEAFQRANRLPASGQIDAKTRRLLAARSGLRVE